MLNAMHERKVAYIDLHKRENILVNERGDPCLIDFQISVAWPRWLPAGTYDGASARRLAGRW